MLCRCLWWGGAHISGLNVILIIKDVKKVFGFRWDENNWLLSYGAAVDIIRLVNWLEVISY